MERVEGNAFKKIIKVLLVDDSAIALAVLKRMLSTDPGINTVGTARNGKEALELIPALEPDVICADLHMPVMDGLEFTREVMDRYPRPILVISISVQEGSHNIFKLLDAGAIDVFPKPRSGTDSDFLESSSDLARRIRILSGVHVFRKTRKEAEPPRIAPINGLSGQAEGRGLFKVVAIGASTGGPQALHYILSTLPARFPVPIICIQHIGTGFLDGLIEWLRSSCALRIEIAAKGEAPRPETVYFPPEGRHLVIDNTGRFGFLEDTPFNGHRPSVTVAFRSIAEHYGSASIGVLLTGMGDDGAEGMVAIAAAGGFTIAQDESTSIVYGMPRRAAELGAASQILPLEKISSSIVNRILAR